MKTGQKKESVVQEKHSPEGIWKERERVKTPIRDRTKKGERRKEKGEGFNTIRTLQTGTQSQERE